MKAKKIILPLLAGLAVASVASCRGGETSTETTTEVESTTGDNGTTTTPTTTKTVHNGALTQINVITNQATISYVLGEKFSADGLKVIAIYSDGTTENLSSGDFEVDYSEFKSNIVGIYNIHVIYKEGQIRKAATYSVTVSSILDKLTISHLLGINVEGMKLTYGIGEQLDTTGLKVIATYSDFTTKDVTAEATADYSRFDSSKMGVYMLKYSYSESYTVNGKSETKLSETFSLATVDGILYGLKFVSGTTTVEQDTTGPDGTMNTLDISDWKVVGQFYSNDYMTSVEAEIDPADLTISGFDSGKAGEKNVTVSYSHGGNTAKTTVKVNVTPIDDPDYVFNASDISYTSDATIATEEAFNSIISFGAKCQVKMESSPKTYGDYSYTKRIQTNGKGSSSTNYIKFTLDKDSTVAIIGRSPKLATEIGFYNESGSAVTSTGSFDADKILKYKYTLKAGTYYFYGTQAIQIYGVQIWYTK